MLLSPVSYTSNHCQAAGISSCDRHNTKIVVSGLSSFSYSFSPQWIWSITIGSCNLFPLVLSLELSPSHFSVLVIEAKAKSFLVLESSNLGFYSQFHTTNISSAGFIKQYNRTPGLQFTGQVSWSWFTWGKRRQWMSKNS